MVIGCFRSHSCSRPFATTADGTTVGPGGLPSLHSSQGLSSDPGPSPPDHRGSHLRTSLPRPPHCRTSVIRAAATSVDHPPVSQTPVIRLFIIAPQRGTHKRPRTTHSSLRRFPSDLRPPPHPMCILLFVPPLLGPTLLSEGSSISFPRSGLEVQKIASSTPPEVYKRVKWYAGISQ